MIVGIDLGTTNSAVGVWRDGAPVLIPNSLGDVLTPSAVGLSEAGELLVGMAARERQSTHPELTATTFKRLMGTQQRIRLGRTEYSAEDLSALVLRSLKADAEAWLGEPVSRAVITVPAYFNDKQRKATRRAGELAGFTVERLVNEPTAAALAYGIHTLEEEEPFLVFDLGGGTFDVSIVEITDGIIEVRASAGDNRLGGEDFNDVLAALAREHFNPGAQLVEGRGSLLSQTLRAAAERARRTLSERDTATIDFVWDGEAHSIAGSAAAFEERAEPLLARMREPVLRSLRDSNIRADSLKEVLLVGGATRMPIVRRAVTRMFGRFPSTRLDPDQAVALGAAVQAGLKARDAALDEVRLTDVCPFTLGIATSERLPGGGIRDDVFAPIIERNTVVPASRVQSFSTVHNGQRAVNVAVYQGESRSVSANVRLGEISIPVPPAPAGHVAVDCRFSYDASSLLEGRVRAQDRRHAPARHLRRGGCAERGGIGRTAGAAGRAKGPSARRGLQRRRAGPGRALLRDVPGRSPRVCRIPHLRVPQRRRCAGPARDRPRPGRPRNSAERARRGSLPVSHGEPWDRLGIAPTEDGRAIRKAYAAQLKQIDVDADPAGFISLREARDEAIWLAEEGLVTAYTPELVTEFEPPLSAELATVAPEPCSPESRRSPWQTPNLDDHGDRISELLFAEDRPADIDAQLRRALEALLNHPDMGEIGRADGVERWLAQTILDGIPRSDPLIAPAINHFRWQEAAQSWNCPWAVQAVLDRYEDCRFRNRAAEPSSGDHDAYRVLTGPVPRWAGLLRPLRVRGFLQRIRRDHPSVERDLNADTVAWWDAWFHKRRERLPFFTAALLAALLTALAAPLDGFAGEASDLVNFAIFYAVTIVWFIDERTQRRRREEEDQEEWWSPRPLSSIQLLRLALLLLLPAVTAVVPASLFAMVLTTALAGALATGIGAERPEPPVSWLLTLWQARLALLVPVLGLHLALHSSDAWPQVTAAALIAAWVVATQADRITATMLDRVGERAHSAGRIARGMLVVAGFILFRYLLIGEPNQALATFLGGAVISLMLVHLLLDPPDSLELFFKPASAIAVIAVALGGPAFAAMLIAARSGRTVLWQKG